MLCLKISQQLPVHILIVWGFLNSHSKSHHILLTRKKNQEDLYQSPLSKILPNSQNLLQTWSLFCIYLPIKRMPLNIRSGNCFVMYWSTQEVQLERLLRLNTTKNQTQFVLVFAMRSEERRVGKECRSRW